MSDPHVVEHLLAYLSGNLDEATSRVVSEHLLTCDECRKEYETVSRFWNELGRLPEESPAPSLEKSFRDKLRGYEEGILQAGRKPEHVRGKGFLDGFRIARPVFQLMAAAFMIFIGFVAGYYINGRGNNAQDMAQLHDEVRGLSNLLTVSLLHQESASERLKGVSWSYKLVGRDPGIDAALVNTMQHDRNVNVRLAALDALSRDVHDPVVRREIIHALPGQTSPLMQIALVDILVQIDDREARDVLQQVLKKADLHPEVRKRIIQGLEHTL
ncbi:MAG: HEAT repeat domain-containing protein [Bacteroidota bacterium]